MASRIARPAPGSVEPVETSVGAESPVRYRYTSWRFASVSPATRLSDVTNANPLPSAESRPAVTVVSPEDVGPVESSVAPSSASA